MLLSKKHKNIEDKHRKNNETGKKIKKNKNSSPNRPKVTPDKKIKKDENSYHYKPHPHSNTQPLQIHKYKDKDAWKNTTKRYDQKSKLLTTSPVLFDRSHSTSQKKSKDKSKDRSVSRVHTHRSNHGDKEREMLKNVTRKLYTQNKEVLKSHSKSKEKSKSKSKSRTRIHTDRDISPFRQNKKTKLFNVADRQVKLKKNQAGESKKKLKKKDKSKVKLGQAYFYLPTDRQEVNEPKVKLKKKVPQIKTQFSQRRDSFFDEKILRKLERSQPEQNYPFGHIKSNIEYKQDNQKIKLHSKSQMKTFEEISSSQTNKERQLQQFKKEQEQKWSNMLYQLQNLKEEKKVPEKIDQIIKQLNENYNSLQEKALFLMKNRSKSNEKSEDEDSYIQPMTKSQKQSEEEIRQPEKNNAEVLPQLKGGSVKQQKQIQNIEVKAVKQNTEERYEDLIPQKQYVNFVEKHSQDNFLDKKQEQIDPNQEQIFQTSKKIAIKQVLSQVKPESQQHEEKKVNPINLNSDFFDFFQNKKDKKLKLEMLFEPQNPSEHKNISSQSINYSLQNKQSDKDLLESLNIIEGASDYVQIVSFNKEHPKFEFQAQLQEIRQIQSEQFHQVLPSSQFQNELKMPEQPSSESILLQSETNSKAEYLLNEIEHVLILQFCTNILRSKQILHNFLTTYSELVEAKMINDDTVGEKKTVPCDNEYCCYMLQRLLNHFEVNYKSYFMEQIQKPFECKPIDILRFIRCAEDESASLVGSSRSSQSNNLAIPFLGIEKIEEFQQEVLKNEYYIPSYLSFNHSIYDFFNELFDELRPYGSRGKSLFSLELSHSVKSFEEAKYKISQKFEECLVTSYYEEKLVEQKCPTQEGIFELIYFTYIEVIQMIIEQETKVLYKVMNK